MIKGINDGCKAHGYSLLFANTDNNLEQEEQGIQSLLDNQVAGLIVNVASSETPVVKGLPFETTVLIDRYLPEKAFDSVTADNYRSTYQAVSYLVERGYRDIYFVSEPLNNIITRSIRYQAFCDVLGLAVRRKQQLVIFEAESPQENSQIIEDILANNPKQTAFFSVNGVALNKLLHVLKALEVRIPQDVGVISHEDWDWMALVGSGITAIRQDSYQMGWQAVELLIRKLGGKKMGPPQIIELASELIRRGSVN